MLNAAQTFERTFKRYKVFDSNFCHKLIMEDGSDKVLGSRDWDDASRAIKFLKNFYDLAIKVSSSLYVSFNIFFSENYYC